MSDSPICEWVETEAALHRGKPVLNSTLISTPDFNAGDDERVIGILTTGPKPIFLQCDNKLQKHRETRPSTLTALEVYARAKDSEPIYVANSGPIIRKPF
ncbi:hypothetical protein [Pseudomonas sp. 6D_7.1_Bac1]|uniref:hypothetical protein n=1 Tax=Pseudomonas sp. 6D_7.1_Bac1 TaxID=2971615 RepID=UPI0021C6235A|nr:hypothetical protein [Pseudomonas sp. 6D_7.1_Bac1]MCU1748374.1 hypothetical protein [Pseudomonas sp. 6D_7.1_Bac1]